MSLVVEDGTGLANADSYISQAAADTYHSDRGNTAWAALSSTVKDQCLRKATDYMTQTYRRRWRGYRVGTTQALDWPRNLVYIDDLFGGRQDLSYLLPNNTVPTEVKNACAELALRASSASLLSDLSQGTVSETVGPISVEYDRHSNRQKQYDAVDGLLKSYLSGSPTSARVNRS